MGDTQYLRDLKPLVFLRREPLEKGNALTSGEGFFLQGKRDRNRQGVFADQPVGMMVDLRLPKLIEREMTDQAGGTPDGEGTSHDCPFGCVTLTRQPSASRTASTLPICAVVFPPSSSTRNRTPTPDAAASSSCRKPCRLRYSRMIFPIWSAVTIIFPSGNTCKISLNSIRYFLFGRKIWRCSRIGVNLPDRDKTWPHEHRAHRRRGRRRAAPHDDGNSEVSASGICYRRRKGML